MRPRGIVAFDFDGTLLRGRTVCELLAEPLGHSTEMRRFEGLSSEQEIADSRAEMAKWYRGRSVEELCAPLSDATWAPGAGDAIRLLRTGGFEVAITSITWGFAVEWMVRPLGVTRILASQLEPGGTVLHVWPRDKGTWVRSLASELEVAQSRIAAVGDSANDSYLLAAAALRFFVGSGSPPPIAGIRHRPAGDIASIAQEIVEGWHTIADDRLADSPADHNLQ
jgi:phosphoserine phosphatase